MIVRRSSMAGKLPGLAVFSLIMTCYEIEMKIKGFIALTYRNYLKTIRNIFR
jgi:hypothetical protein